MEKLSINVYRFPLGDCTNGGISGKAISLDMVVYDEGEEIHEEDGDVMLDKRVLFGRESYRLIPTKRVSVGCVGWMMGGNFGYSSDARWERYTGVNHPLPIHDRQDTQAQYDTLSR